MTEVKGFSGPYRRLNVLVVEDETVLSLDIEDALEDLGHTVVAVASQVPRAIDEIERRASRLDCVVLDPELAQTSAQPVAERLARRGIPYVLITDLGERELLKRGFSAPAVTAPCQALAFDHALAEALEARTSRSEARPDRS